MASIGQSDIPSQRVGVDVGSHTIKAVEVVERVSELTIRAVGSVPVPIRVGEAINSAQDRSALVQAIKHLWSSAQFESDKVILGLPPSSVYLKWLRIECDNDEELDHLARTTAARGAPFPAEDALSDYRIISCQEGRSTNIYHVMLASASASAVNLALDLSERCGLDPIATDIGILAALRSVETERHADRAMWSGQPRAHCLVGATDTSIGVMREDALEFARSIPIGGNDFTKCVAEQLGVGIDEAEKIKMSPNTRLAEDGTLLLFHEGSERRIPCRDVVERLSREIARSLRFFSSQFAEGSYLGMTGTISLSGGGALLKGLDTYLRNNGMEVSEVVNPFSGFSVEAKGSGVEQAGGRSTLYTTAMGLAVWDYWDRFAQVGAKAA